MTVAELRAMGLSMLTTHPDAQRDIDQLISHALGQDIAWVLAHPEFKLDEEHTTKLKSLLQRRADHEPLAYIVGIQPFYGRDFLVTPDVLIPRPESELIIDQLKTDVPADAKARIVDVGTGSGALAIIAALERPHAQVTAVDISEAALRIAKQNAAALKASNVTFVQGYLLEPISDQNSVDAIMANLPYLPAEEIEQSPTSKELSYEPQMALLADDEGLALIKTCTRQAAHILKNGGKLYLEMLPGQIPMFLGWLLAERLPFSSNILTDLSGQNRIVVLTSVWDNGKV